MTTLKLGRLVRSVKIERNAVDTAARTVELAFSSETPVERWFGNEVLGHKPGECNLDWLSSGRAPLLLDHHTGQQIGVIERAWIGNDGVGRALARFSESPRADQELKDCAAGIRVNISVGYQIDELELVAVDGGEPGDDDAESVYRATKWTPLEVSTVAIPADMSVGVGRAAGDEAREVPVVTRQNQQQQKRTRVMETEIEKAQRLERERMERENAERAQREADDRARIERERSNGSQAADILRAERQRVADIRALGTAHNQGPLAQEHIEKGTSIELFRGILLATIPSGTPLEKPLADIGMSDKDAKRFSVLRMMLAQLALREGKDPKAVAPFELEASNAVAQRVGVPAKGFYIPMDVQRQEIAPQQRALTVGTNTGAGYFVSTDLMPQDFITLLRNRMMVRAMGATVVSGLVGNVAFPKHATAGTAYWVAEGSGPTASDQVVAQVTMTPRQIMAMTDYSRLLMQQSSLDVENFVRDDLATILALGIDLAALHGTGADNQPTGLAATSGIGSVAGGTNGLAPTWAHIVALETAVAVANADVGATGYLSNAKVRGKLKTTLKNPSGTDGTFIWPDVAGPMPGFGLLNGYKAGTSNQVSSTLTKGNQSASSAIFFGNWADMMIGEWGVLDVLVNPYTGATAGTVRIHVYQSVDIAVRRAASFAAMLDALTA